MANDRGTSSIPQKDTDNAAPADSDSEAEDVFHDARFPADEEAVSYVAPPPPPNHSFIKQLEKQAHTKYYDSDCWKSLKR